MDRARTGNSKLGVSKGQNRDNSLYYAGEKDKHEDRLRGELVKLQNNNDFEGLISVRTTLSNLKRGQFLWVECTRELRLAQAGYRRKSPGSIAQIEAAQGALLFEKGQLESAAAHLAAALGYLDRCPDLDSLRQFVSSTWKAAEIAHALGDLPGGKRGIDKALRFAETISDLHGYCNARIAEAHIAITEREFKQAVESLLWVSHPPQSFTGQPEPRFIYGELARAWAVLEWEYYRTHLRYLGFVHPLWALEFAQKRLNECMSFVMRVPFLDQLAIASPAEMSSYFSRQLGMPPKGRGKRPQFGYSERQWIYERYDGLCVLCRKVIDRQEKLLHVDHIVHHSLGHSPKGNLLLNYRPTCIVCNEERSNNDFTRYSDIGNNNPTRWVEILPHDVWVAAFPTR